MVTLIDNLISWLPSGITLFTAGSLILVGIGLLVYQYFYLLPHRTLALILGAVAIASGMYLSGAGNQKHQQEIARLSASLHNAKELNTLQGKLLASKTKDSQQAAKDQQTLDELQKRIDDAKNQTVDGQCFDADDIKRLQRIWEGSTP